MRRCGWKVKVKLVGLRKKEGKAEKTEEGGFGQIK
jgi:hypothetical protein